MKPSHALALLLAPGLAIAAPAAQVRPDPVIDPLAPRTGAVCTDGDVRCHAHVEIGPTGEIIANASPIGWTASDIQSAYQIVPAHQTAATVAVVDAYGYANLESDLAHYRAQMGLPPCTKANGCLVVLNQNGQSAPLPGPPTPSFDWTLETAIDVETISAACPSCKIVVFQSIDTSFAAMYTALQSALARNPDAISMSWGAAEQNVTYLTIASVEAMMAQYPGVGVFASSGDDGYQLGGQGPQYPATGSRVVAVGGTVLAKAANARGWTETAWSGAGSSCSNIIPKLPTQTSTACAHRSTADVSAVAMSVATYNAGQGGWLATYGTSIASPLIAAAFAGYNGGATGPTDIPSLVDGLNDITSGSNGTCAGALCNAGPGWDGPTGYGTPNLEALASGTSGMPGASVSVVSPQEGQIVAPGFTVELAVTGQVTVTVSLDGVPVGSKSAPPYAFVTPASTAPGAHRVQLHASDSAGNSSDGTIDVIVMGSGSGGSDQGSTTSVLGGGCDAGGGAGLALPCFALALRRRRSAQRRE